jgi:ubiquinone/menaquinone biosynthesis C-methylase UbiE
MENRQKKERRFWDRFANYYDSFIDKIFKKTYKDIIENLESDLDLNQNVLEIGTGTGIIPFSIYSKVASIIATDISPEMIRVANQRLIDSNIKNINFQIQDSYSLTFTDKSFDIVIASNLFHILYEPEKPINEVKRVLRDNGIFIAPTICAGESTKTRVIATVVGAVSGFKVVNKWSINEFRTMLINNGFAIKKTVTISGRFPVAYIVMTKGKAMKT